MNKKKINFLVIIIPIFIICGIGIFTMVSLFQTPDADTNNNTLHWLPKESKFVNYEISGDKVKFRYSICFVNNSKNTANISLSAKFKASELNGWMKNEKFFTGLGEDGELKKGKIEPGEKINFIFVFEGKYLGGKVNENISFPEEIILMSN